MSVGQVPLMILIQEPADQHPEKLEEILNEGEEYEPVYLQSNAHVGGLEDILAVDDWVQEKDMPNEGSEFPVTAL